MRIKLVFAGWQKTFDGSYIPLWHVDSPGHANHKSTLSLTGLKEWGIL